MSNAEEHLSQVSFIGIPGQPFYHSGLYLRRGVIGPTDGPRYRPDFYDCPICLPAVPYTELTLCEVAPSVRGHGYTTAPEEPRRPRKGRTPRFGAGA